MNISLIAAVSSNNVIGKKGVGLLWHLPDDFKHFKELTMGKPIIMGRTTYDTIGRILPGRTNIILTSQPDYSIDGAVVVHSINDALDAAEKTGASEAMIIGGAQIYKLFLPLANKIYLTEVHADINGDVDFPVFDRSGWHKVSRETHPTDEKHAYPFSFVTLDK